MPSNLDEHKTQMLQEAKARYIWGVIIICTVIALSACFVIGLFMGLNNKLFLVCLAITVVFACLAINASLIGRAIFDLLDSLAERKKLHQ